MERLLLFLPSATYRSPDFLAAARELGVAVTVASERRAAMSAAMGEGALTLRLDAPRPPTAAPFESQIGRIGARPRQQQRGGVMWTGAEAVVGGT